MTKHVDDLKIAGEPKIIVEVMQGIEKTFGKLKIQWNEFTNCGVHHVQDKVSKGCSLDQIDYAKNLKAIVHDEVQTKPTESDCGPELHQLYQSLLGAVAYLYLTRTDVLVFISGLQRWAHKPKIIHVKRLNKVLRWVQRNPRKLEYPPFDLSGKHFRIVSDAAFKKEDEKGHSLRGTLYLSAPGSSLDHFHRNGPIHILEYLSKAQRHVTRSTFSSELHACCDAADLGVLLLQMLHEIDAGPVTAQQSREMRMNGGYCIPMVLQIDAMSVFAAITATYVKAPAEKSLLSHVQFVRELLDTKVLTALHWIDTRDMLADGLTKGSVERDALADAMAGWQQFAHEYKTWSAKVLKPTQQLIQESLEKGEHCTQTTSLLSSYLCIVPGGLEFN